MKDSFQEPKYTWPIVKLLKIRENLRNANIKEKSAIIL